MTRSPTALVPAGPGGALRTLNPTRTPEIGEVRLPCVLLGCSCSFQSPQSAHAEPWVGGTTRLLPKSAAAAALAGGARKRAAAPTTATVSLDVHRRSPVKEVGSDADTSIERSNPQN